MAKTKEELNQLKNEYESLVNNLQELTEDELMQVTGGVASDNLNKIQAERFLQLAPTSLDIAAGLGKSNVGTTRKRDDASIGINLKEAR